MNLMMPEENIKKFPVALEQYLKQHSKVHTIHLHLDNDEIGRGAAEGISMI